MKTAWDSYLDEQLADPTVRRACMRTLIRYAEAVGMNLDLRLVPKES